MNRSLSDDLCQRTLPNRNCTRQSDGPQKHLFLDEVQHGAMGGWVAPIGVLPATFTALSLLQNPRSSAGYLLYPE